MTDEVTAVEVAVVEDHAATAATANAERHEEHARRIDGMVTDIGSMRSEMVTRADFDSLRTELTGMKDAIALTADVALQAAAKADEAGETAVSAAVVAEETAEVLTEPAVEVVTDPAAETGGETREEPPAAEEPPVRKRSWK